MQSVVHMLTAAATNQLIRSTQGVSVLLKGTTGIEPVTVTSDAAHMHWN